MKKTLILIMCLLFLVGCSNEQSGELKDKQVSIDGKVISLGDDMESAKTILGDDFELTETKSCMYDGNDKIFDYETVSITTYPDGEKDYINSILFADAGITWKYDIGIGDSVDAITSTLTGESTIQEDYLWTFEYDDYGIAFYIDNDQITEIELYSL